MSLAAFYGLLLAVSSLCGPGNGQNVGGLRTLPNDGGDISCTGELSCEQSEILCIPEDMQTALSPVLVPSDLKAENVKKCDNDGCSLCIRVTVEISAAFLTARSEELGSGNCDYEHYEDYEEIEDGNETGTAAVNLYLQLNTSSNDSLLCANLIISPPSYSCYTMRVSLPRSALPLTSNSSSTVVGSLVYNCIRVLPGAEMNITSYSNPRYSKILSISHKVPDCTELDPLDNISKCESPVLDFTHETNETSVGIVNGTNSRNISVWIFHSCSVRNTYSFNTLTGKERQHIPQSDIVPCMCIQAWYSDVVDAFRTMLCPFRNYSAEGMLNKSKLELRNDKIAVYEFVASCHVVAEASMCWKSGNTPECRPIPNTRKEIVSKKKYPIEGLAAAHPSLCVQVSVEGRVLHTECLNTSVRREFQNEALLVLENPSRNLSRCLMEGRCKTLYSIMYQSSMNNAFLEQKLVEDLKSDQCVKVLSGPKQDVYLCSVDKYMRSRWTWSRVLCLLVVACVLLILLLKIDDLKKWVKSVTTVKTPDEIFKYRKVLILYSPDNPAYEELVRVFAYSLQELKLDVVLDQWHRTEMAKVNPLPWYQKQKSDVFENQGLIILLFSEGARELYTACKERRAEQVVYSDPYGSFGAVLNCVYPDFQTGQAKGRYLVATFSPSSDVVPDLFTLLPIYALPSSLRKLLQELVWGNTKVLGRQRANRLSAKIRDRLQEPLKEWQRIMDRKTVSRADGRGLSEPPSFSEKLVVELEPLV